MPESFRRSGYYKDPSKTVARRSHALNDGGKAKTHGYAAQPRGLILGGAAAPSGIAGTPDRASFTVPAAGTLRMRACLALNVWRTTGSVNQVVLGQRPAGGLSWHLNMFDGAINVAYGTDGSSFVANRFSATKVPFLDGSPGWIEALVETDIGGGNRRNSFAYSYDGKTWIPINIDTQAGAVTLFDSTGDLTAGNFTGGGSQGMDGVLFEACVAINGVIAANPKFYAQPPRQPSFRDDQGNLWTPGSGAIIGVV